MHWLMVALGVAVSLVTSGYAAGEESASQQKAATYLFDKLAGCWNITVGDGSVITITRVQISLNRDGSLAGPPKVLNPATEPQGKMFNQSAARAIARCAPFTGLAAYVDSYQAWREITVNFDARDMSSTPQQK
ncbi:MULTISPECIES: cell envelope integrity protein TolA [unclassified Mesorhizobium]|uniref:cell envelope integrity protein TolA n=1 Tax=unclassified Mesorhizobium TaxID=325217 RepID=UPI00041BFC76|nr:MULTISPECIES: cell envelope integrity protein TolA [unclassified Mesorhizobium]WJI42220.1 cell envelope integrity protein TolA [Mesorhizobium sp. C120A]